MNMLKMLKQAWYGSRDVGGTAEPQKEVPAYHAAAPEAEPSPSPNLTNVIALPINNWNGPTPIPDDTLPFQQVPPPIRFKGLLNAPELEAFFQENFFGYGRHTGSKFRTQEILDQGKQSITSQFQNKLTELIERKQEKLNKLQSEIIAIEGVSNSMSAQLRLACDHLQRDIRLLREQVEAAATGKGWILEPLQRYHIGFTKGLREALEFELIAG